MTPRCAFLADIDEPLQLGYNWTIRIWAILLLLFVGTALWGANPRIPPRKLAAGLTRAPFIPLDRAFLTNGSFYAFVSHLVSFFFASDSAMQCAIVITNNLAFIPVSLYIPSFAATLGLTRSQGNGALSLFNGSSVLAQVLVGYLTDRMSFQLIIAISCTCSAIFAFLLWGFADTLATTMLFAALFGAAAGGFTSTWPAAAKRISTANPQQAGLSAFAPHKPCSELTVIAVLGCFAAVKGVTAIVSPIIAAALYQPSHIKRVYG